MRKWSINESGYFHLFYYDKFISDVISYDFIISTIKKNDDIQKINQYNLLPSINGWGVYRNIDNSIKYEMAIVFTGIKYHMLLFSNVIREYDIYIINDKYIHFSRWFFD